MASPSEGPLRRFIREIHRRSLWQVLGIYLVASWAVLQVVDTLGGALNLPDWFPSFALALLIVGLPIVLATAFVQEGGPGRETGDVNVDGAPTSALPPGGASGLFTWRNAILGGVGAFALLGFVGFGWVLFGGGIGGGSGSGDAPNIEQSVAVLPFDNMSGDPDNEYFSDGITEELLNALAQLPDLRVPGRTSSFAFKGQNITIQQIADTLDVTHILEGSVRRAGERVLITAQLVDAQTDSHLWSDTYERELNDIFAIQREIATAIADQLQVTLSGGVEVSLAGQGTQNPEAHEAYLRGRHLWNQRTRESILASIEEFQRAVDLDLGYAEAWSGLADAHLVFMHNHGGVGDVGFLDEGLRFAERAVETAPDLGMAHASLGLAYNLRGAWAEAQSSFERAVVLSPQYASAYHWFGQLLGDMGRADEAIVVHRRGVELDPVSQVVGVNLGASLSAAGRIAEATEQLRRVIDLDPQRPMAWMALTSTLLEAGEYAAASEAALERARLDPAADMAVEQRWIQAAIGYLRSGEPKTFRFPEGYEGLMESPPRYGWTGQRGLTLEALELAATTGVLRSLSRFHTSRHSDLLRDDPRYQALLEEAGITW